MPIPTEENLAPVLTELANGFAITGTKRSEALTGSAGNDVIDGRGGNDRLHGGAGDDTLTGGLNEDTFVINYKDWGDDTITDLDPDETLVLPRSVVGTEQNVLDHAHAEGGDTVIDFGTDQTVTLLGVDDDALPYYDIWLI
jgi:Ca2+-binding RTX toxin-like protein